MPLDSVNYDLSVLIGETLWRKFLCYTDDEFTQEFDFTGYELEAVITTPSDSAAAISLTETHGLAVDRPTGIIELESDTSSWVRGRGRWYLQATDPDGLVSYPLRGILFVGTP